ncbi:hypothetical protein HS088_TW03G01304 [Tripterygium wilfordii]|uniref:Uncharacterized protein n=1 Tax=Tripterygium wilfordii TaxID=458696 RepID=A0A7J7DXD3_TRIWF|nr:hypothetical protein HS088_TW03G01304 [Tripterygium wilfordii]
MAVPLPYPIIRSVLLMKSNTNMVVPYCDRVARVGFQGIGVSREDDANNILLELRFLFGELGVAVVGIIVGIREIGSVKEEVFEGLGKERVVVSWRRVDLQTAHQGLEEEIVEVGGERAHDVFVNKFEREEEERCDEGFRTKDGWRRVEVDGGFMASAGLKFPEASGK